MKGEMSGNLGRHQKTDRFMAPTDAAFLASSLLLPPCSVFTLMLMYTSSSACPSLFFGWPRAGFRSAGMAFADLVPRAFGGAVSQADWRLFL